MNIGKETKAYWGDKFIEILDPHKPGHIIRVYPDYWDEKAPIREQGEPKEWVGLTNEQIVDLVIKNAGFPTKLAKAIEAKLKENNS